MEKVSARKSAVLEVLDEQIGELERKLAKAQPLFDELNQLKRARATLLSERSVTGNVRAGTQVTMEEVIHFLRENGPSSPPAIATGINADANTVRSHLNRHKDVRYMKNGDGNWSLIGEVMSEDDEDEDEDEVEA
jgi:hypothetical protein